MTIILRSACQFHGIPIGPNVARMEIPYRGAKPQYITWAQILKARRERQANILRGIYATSTKRAVRISCWYLDTFIYGGWHCYIDAVAAEPYWVRREYPELMRRYPLADKWEDWKPAFARAFQKDTCCGKPRGVVFAWAEYHGKYFHDLLPGK